MRHEDKKTRGGVPYLIVVYTGMDCIDMVTYIHFPIAKSLSMTYEHSSFYYTLKMTKMMMMMMMLM